MSRGKGVARLYKSCPTEMLAFRIASIFIEIKTEEDRVRHNDAWAEVQAIINSSYPEKGKFSEDESRFIDRCADYILHPAKNDFRKKRLFFRLAEKALHFGNKKGN